MRNRSRSGKGPRPFTPIRGGNDGIRGSKICGKACLCFCCPPVAGYGRGTRRALRRPPGTREEPGRGCRWVVVWWSAGARMATTEPVPVPAGTAGSGAAAARGVERGGVGSVVEQLVDGAGEPGIRVQVLGGGRRRPRLPTPRGHRVVVRLSDEERAAVAAGAGRLGLSAGAFLSAAGVAVARGEGPRVDTGAGVSGPAGVDRGFGGVGLGSGGVGLDRRTGDALDDLETQLGRVGNLLNQAVRVAHRRGRWTGGCWGRRTRSGVWRGG